MWQVSNIFLFTGENSFALRQGRARWIREFTQKHGEENLLRLEGKGVSVREMLDEVSIAPFIADRRLVVLDGIPKWTREEMELLLQQIHPSVIVVFVDSKPDKRLGGVKVLVQIADQRTFPLLAGRELRSWTDDVLHEAGASMEDRAKNLLFERVGEDQEMLYQELQKLSLGVPGRPIEQEDIEELTVPSREWLVWHLTDLLARGQTREAFLYARTLLESGQDPFSLWNILLWMLRNLVLVTSYHRDGVTGVSEIARRAKLNPQSVRAMSSLVQSMNAESLMRLVNETVEADKGLKTGEYRVSQEDSQELMALIDRFILRCA